MPHDVGIGHIAAEMLKTGLSSPFKSGVFKPTPFLTLSLIKIGLYPTVPVRRFAVFNVNGVHHAFAKEPMVLFAQRRKHRVWTGAVKRAC